MADFRDPRLDDPVDALSDLAEKADADYATAVNECAVAENALDKAYYSHLAECEERSAAGREQYAKHHTVDERAVSRIKAAVEKSADKHLRTTLARLSAAQTKHRSVDRLAG